MILIDVFEFDYLLNTYCRSRCSRKLRCPLRDAIFMLSYIYSHSPNSFNFYSRSIRSKDVPFRQELGSLIRSAVRHPEGIQASSWFL
jgi:hypothetical protein